MHSFTVPVPDMRLWTLDDPYLYEVSASLDSNEGKDEVNTYFGMRKFSAVPDSRERIHICCSEQ